MENPGQETQKKSSPSASADGLHFPERLTTIEGFLAEQFGQDSRAILEVRFGIDRMLKSEAEAVVARFQARGWSVAPRRDEADIVFEFSNPPSGILTLTDRQQKQLRTLLSRLDRSLAEGLPEGSKRYPLIGHTPYRVVYTAVEILRMRGFGVTLELGSRAAPKALVVSVPT